MRNQVSLSLGASSHFSLIALAAFAVMGVLATAAGLHAQESPSRQSATGVPLAPLFFGKDTAPWLPKTESLPTGADVEKSAEKLSSRARNVDPFGVPTFPTEEDALPDAEDSSRPTPRVTLNQALGTLKINGVNLGSKAFLIGGRNVFEGDVIELAFRNELFKALVVEVNATTIVFHDFARNEDGVILHSIIRQLELEPLPRADGPLKARMTPMEPFTPRKK